MGGMVLVSGGPYYDGEWPWGRLAAALGATPDPRTLRPSLYQFATARFDIFQPIVIEKNLQTCVCHSYD